MAMTIKGTLPAAAVDVLPDDADQVHVTTGSEAEPTVVAVAGRTHMRVLGEGRHVLYHRGEHIAAEHVELPIVSAELDGGVWVAKGRERKPPALPERDTGQPTTAPERSGIEPRRP
jgi:hypothetical protein